MSSKAGKVKCHHTGNSSAASHPDIRTLSFLEEAGGGEICLFMGVKGQKKFQTIQKLLLKSMPVLFLEKNLIT